MTVTRFAPSPTGYLHVGNLRTALFNYLIARRQGGEFILRLDDTDPERSTRHYADEIMRDMEWLGLTWDRVERQSHRLDRYKEAARQLRDISRFYECFETPAELDLKRRTQLNMGNPPVYDRSALVMSDSKKEALRKERGDGHWRFRLDHARIVWQDGILGGVSIDAASVSDPVLIRGDGQFLYTLASVCDDVDFGITHVVRGADHVTNTATQIQIIQAMGATPPAFAHHSLLTGPRGEALSKRLGSTSLRELRNNGVEPMALLSLMVNLGSSKPVELISEPDTLWKNFDLSNYGAAPAKFNADDLGTLTARVVSSLDYAAMEAALRAMGVPDDVAPAFWAVVRDNSKTRAHAEDWWKLCRDGADPLIAPEDSEFVATARSMLPDQPWDKGTWNAWTSAVQEITGRKGRGLLMPLRKALTGRAHGPDMGRLMPLLQTVKW
ncbi:MAG: glutamate--tRNA ligase [Rhodobacteraceae bacterium]|nr:glutamate--tRNA ligase [Paracoccaceae bacterium]